MTINELKNSIEEIAKEQRQKDIQDTLHSIDYNLKNKR